MSDEKTDTDSLSSISRGASLYVIGKLSVDSLGFLFHFILTRGLGAGLYGIYAYAKTIVSIAIIFTNLGSDKSILKYLPEYEENKTHQEFVLALAITTSLIGGLVVAGTLYISAPYIAKFTLDEPELVSVLRLFSLILIFDTLAKVLHNTFRSLERLEYEVLSNKFVRPAVRLLAVTVALVLGFSIIGVMIALIAASALVVLVALYFFLTRFSIQPRLHRDKRTKQNVYEYYNFSIPLTLKDVGQLLTTRIDIFMVGLFFSSTVVGIYNISVLIAGFIKIPQTGFNQLFPPIASKLYSNEEIDKLSSIYNIVTRWTFTLALLPAILIAAYRREILSLFGSDFTIGTTVLLLFVFAQLWSSLGAGNGYVLLMTNHQYVVVANQWTFGVVNIFLNYLMLLRFGLIGAAAATATIMIFLNIIKTIELWYLERLFPYSIDFLKPIGAALTMMIILYISDIFLQGLPLIFVGGALGVVTYVTTLILLGVDEEDKTFFRNNLNRFLPSD